VLDAARTAGTVHESVTASDVAAAVRAMRGVAEIDDAAWHRHLAFILAGFRAGPERLDD
jgi:hypothetical protein